MRYRSALICIVLFLLAPLVTHAAEPTNEPAVEGGLALGLPFRDHMILQRGIDLPIWGSAPAGATVTVMFDTQVKHADADKNGKWRVTLDPLMATKLTSADAKPEGKKLTVTAKHSGKTFSIKLEDLVVGDVWLCAGQSNMAGRLKGKGTYQGEVADYPGYRHWTPTTEGGWNVCSPETAGLFNKTAFYFGREVYKETLIPTAIVVAAVGGSKIEPWLNIEPYETGKHYTTFIEPLVGLGIRGMVWYQGESNANKRDEPYGPKLTALIKGYREAWDQGDFPAYFVQLPGYGERKNEMGNKPGWPALRQDQLETLTLKNTGMVVTIDIGDKSIHPPNKVDTGKRLARAALYQTYGMKKQAPTGPLYESQIIDGATVTITFKYASGLMLAEKEGLAAPMPTTDKSLACLQLRDEAGTWHPAEGKIENDKLIITSKAVPKPVAARYAYFPHPAGPLLYNKDGLPASPFTTEREIDRDQQGR